MSNSSTSLNQFSNPEGYSVKIREYRSEDSTTLCQMIIEEDKLILGGGLIHGQKQISTDYHQILSRYPEQFTIIAEDTKDPKQPKLCACISLGIKYANNWNKKVKTGVILNLKVASNYRGIGLASFLIKEIEAQGLKRDVKYFYTYIDTTNQSYQELFKSWGYNQANNIKEVVGLLKTRKKVDYTKKVKDLGVIKYKEISSEELTSYLEKNCTKTSNKLVSEDIAITSKIIKAYSVEDEQGNHLSGVLQYNAELQTKHQFKRFVLPSSFFEKSSLKFILYFLSLIISLSVYFLLSFIEEYRLLINGSIAGGFHIATLFIYIKFYRLHELFKASNEALGFEFYYRADSKYRNDVIGLLRENFYYGLKEAGYRSVRILADGKENELNLLHHDILGDYILVTKTLEGDLKERVFIDPRDVIHV